MNPLLSQPAVRLYAASCVALVLGFHAFAYWTGRIRAERKAVVNPEDVTVYAGSVVADMEHPDVLRVKRAHLNLIENAVPFFIVAFLYALTNPSPPMAAIFFVTFVGTRLLHAFFYLTARQPSRAAMFGVGMIVNLIMAFQVMRAVV